jgi:WD40 repeat protein
MEIFYIQSAGISQEQDYSWQKISNNCQQAEDEPELVREFKHLLNTQAYSILVGRKRQQLILLVTGMKASQRQDYRGRNLRNSIAFITDETSENEKEIRRLTIAALNHELETPVDKAITSGGRCGFEVDFQKIKILINESIPENIGIKVTKDTFCKIGKNSKRNTTSIANELERNSLPKNIETLVVVTQAKDENTLKKAKVWRGLSNLVKSETLVEYNIEDGFLKEICKEYNPLKIFSAMSLISVPIAFLLIFNPVKPIVSTSLTPLAVISSNAQYIAVRDVNSELQVKDKTNKLIAEVPVNQDSPIKSVAISSNGQYVATGNAKGEVLLYSVNNVNLEKIANQVQHNGEVLSVAIMVSDNSSKKDNPTTDNSKKPTITIVSGGSDGEVKMFTFPPNQKSY